MTTIEVLAGSVGEGGRNDEKDVKLVRRLLDDWWAREAGEPGGRPLPVDGPMEPRTLAAIPGLTHENSGNHMNQRLLSCQLAFRPSPTVLTHCFRILGKVHALALGCALLERTFHPERLDAWFEQTADAQYTRELLFSTWFELMSQVGCGVRRSVHEARFCCKKFL